MSDRLRDLLDEFLHGLVTYARLCLIRSDVIACELHRRYDVAL